MIELCKLHLVMLIGFIELSLKHPEIPGSLKIWGADLGRQLFDCLLEEGFMAPEEVLKDYRKAFYI